MSLHARKILHLKPTYELVVSKVLFSLGSSVATVGVPLYFIKVGLSSSQIGIFTGIIALVMAATSLYLPPVLERFNQRRLLIVSAFFTSACFALFGLAGSVSAVLLLALAQISLHINENAFIVMFKDSTRSMEEFTKDTGLLGSFTNLGWFIGPLLGGLALSGFGFKGVFILAGSLIMIGGFYVLIFPFRTVIKRRVELDGDIKANVKYYLSSPHLRLAYIQRFGVDLWWGLILTFIPIFMLKGGYSGATIGLFISLTQLPLFLFEFKTVDFVEKYGFKRIFTGCYLSLTLVCIFSFLAMPSYLIVALGLVLVGSLSLSFLEPITDLFFFSKLSMMEEEKAYPTYATASPLSGVVGRILPGLTLLFFYDRAVFLSIGALILFITYKARAIRS